MTDMLTGLAGTSNQQKVPDTQLKQQLFTFHIGGHSPAPDLLLPAATKSCRIPPAVLHSFLLSHKLHPSVVNFMLADCSMGLGCESISDFAGHFTEKDCDLQGAFWPIWRSSEKA